MFVLVEVLLRPLVFVTTLCMLWIKSLHLIFVVAWFAGLFYLPRLFVYHVELLNADGSPRDEEGHRRFCTMENRLYRFTSLNMLLATVFGVWLLVDYAWAAFASQGWLHAKLTLVFFLIGFHHMLGAMRKRFARAENKRSARYYRILNEVPTVFLFIITILVIVKPF